MSIEAENAIKSGDSNLYIGLMSGTSIDGIDVALIDLNNGGCQLLKTGMHPIDPGLKAQIAQVSQIAPQHSTLTVPPKQTIHRIELLAELDHQLGLLFAEAVNHFIQINNICPRSIKAIGSHGQTVRHRPEGGLSGSSPFTLQIGDPNLIAYHTGIETVADFRRMDMAAGGQGAPLAPAFHNALMRSAEENRIILNLGGIANITLLPQSTSSAVIGFDTGPANTLLDDNFVRHHPDSEILFDRNGAFASEGEINQALLNLLLSDPYFTQPIPKSTGREYFSRSWLERALFAIEEPVAPSSIQMTLQALTVSSVGNAINKLGLADYQVYVCGGGMHNHLLIKHLSEYIERNIKQTNQIGIDGDYLEAMTFAWLAHQRLDKKASNLPSVTGAKNARILGAIYHP